MVIRFARLGLYVADALDAADVFLYRDSSVAPMLDMRRRFKAFVDVLGAMIRSGISLSRSVELAVQWDRILALGPIGVWTLVHSFMPLLMFIAVLAILFILLLFIVVMRRLGGGGVGFQEDPLMHPYRWHRLDLVPPALFLQCKPHLTPGGSGVLSDPARIDEEFRKAWLPYFCRSGQREASLEEFDREVEEWLALLPEVHLPRLTGQMLADVAGGLDGWGWREFKVLPVSWYDGLARILTKVEDVGVGCLHHYDPQD